MDYYVIDWSTNENMIEIKMNALCASLFFRNVKCQDEKLPNMDIMHE